MMIEHKLQKWIDALKQIAAVELDITTTGEQLISNLEKRQQSINEIRKLDAFIAETLKTRELGWPEGMDRDTKDRSETLIIEALSTCSSIVSNDREVLVKAKEKRQDILSQLGNSKRGKGYLPSSSSPKARPPVIFDDNA